MEGLMIVRFGQEKKKKRFLIWFYGVKAIRYERGHLWLGYQCGDWESVCRLSYDYFTTEPMK